MLSLVNVTQMSSGTLTLRAYLFPKCEYRIYNLKFPDVSPEQPCFLINPDQYTKSYTSVWWDETEGWYSRITCDQSCAQEACADKIREVGSLKQCIYNMLGDNSYTFSPAAGQLQGVVSKLATGLLSLVVMAAVAAAGRVAGVGSF